MPSSAPEDWRDGLYQDLARDERLRTPAALGGAPSLSRYEILGVLGEGAAGVVYRARHRELGQRVALKVLRPIVGQSEVARQRFRREAQTAAGLSHPHVVAVHDAGEEGGSLYLVMELVEGKPLSEVLAGRRAPRADLVRILEQAARGVGAAHEQGIVHRDLKPANILVTASGEPKVGDFGLAHLLGSSAELTKTGSTLGTPLYMAPEQVEGRAKEITPRTDVYSLGAILYEIVTGRPPHTGATPMELYGKILHEEPAPPRSLNADVPRDLEAIALKALEKEPEGRYATATAFADDLLRSMAGEPIEARPVGLAHRVYRRWRRNRLAICLALGAALALLAAAGVWGAAREKSRRLQAGREKREVELLRDHARVSLDAVLKLRRAGANREMAEFIPGFESAYRQALESAPNLAEIEYLMGRMHRVLLQDEKAEVFQERALQKDPTYAPALYERAILLARRYGVELGKAIAESRHLPDGPVTAKVARGLPPLDPGGIAGGREPLVLLRDRILLDCATLERSIAAGRSGTERQHVREVHLRTVRGVLAFHRKEYPEARRILEEVVRDEPMLEDGWHALGTTAARQASLLENTSESREDVVSLFDAAEALWSRAISHDLGYGPHWLGRALLSRSRGLFFMKRGGDALPDLRKAEADLGRAMELKADAPEALYRRANVRDLAGITLMGLGKEPSADFDAAEKDLSEGIARYGGRGEFWIARAGVRLHRGLFQSRRREDPFAEFARAEEDLTNALRLEPWIDAASDALGYLKLTRSGFRKRRGEDPMPDLVSAERDLTEAVRRNREFTSAWNSRGCVRQEKALCRSERGEDSLEELLRAEEDFSEALRLTPSHPEAWVRRGRVRTHLGRSYEKKGDPPKAAANSAAAVNDLLRGFALNPSLEGQYATDLSEARRRVAAQQPN